MVKRRVVYAKSAVLSSPINKALDLQNCVDCLRNYTRMYRCYLTQCVLYRVYWQLDTLLLIYIIYSWLVYTHTKKNTCPKYTALMIGMCSIYLVVTVWYRMPCVKKLPWAIYLPLGILLGSFWPLILPLGGKGRLYATTREASSSTSC